MSYFNWLIYRLPRFNGSFYKKFFFLILLFFAIYYPVGMFIVHKVDDDLTFQPTAFTTEGGSHAVSIMAALIDRETRRHHWTPNDPWFFPGYMLDRMPAFQRGVISGTSRFAVELSDQLSRARSSSQVDPELEKAAGLLKYSPYVWVFDFSTSYLPTVSSQKQYQAAAELLMSYNRRLATGNADFEKRADNLLESLERIATDLGSSSGTIAAHIRANKGDFIDPQADEIFYFVKGRMYAIYLIMRELEKDYGALMDEKQLRTVWKQTMDSLGAGATLSNFFIFNADPNSQFFPNHLAAQGFYLMRARIQLKEVTNILLK